MNSKSKHGRMCIGCGQMKEKAELIRIVKDQEGSILIDASGRLNGRGAYICRSSECMDTARKRKALERSFKCKISDETYDMLDEEIKRIET